MTDALVYNIPAWSKDIDPLFACDKTMLFPDHLSPSPDHSATGLYVARRMSDSALSADTGTSTTTDPDSPATEPDSAGADLAHDSRKPSLPGIGALTPLLDPADAFPRRASLPTLTSDLSLLRSPGPTGTLSRASFRPRTYDSQLSAYSFPPASPLGHAHSNSDPENGSARPRLDPSFGSPYFGHGQSSAGTSATGTSFPSPFTSPLSPDYHARSGSLPRDEGAFNPFGQPSPQGRWPADGQQAQWSPGTPDVPPTPASASASNSATNSPRARAAPKRRASASPPAPAPAPQAQQGPDGQPQRRRGKLPKHTTDLLKEWLHAHSDHPYPSEDEKRDLCARTKLSMSQVSNWMINARRRILAPAKHPIQAPTTTEPYRTLGAAPTRPIGSLYPTHAHHNPHAHPHAQHLYPHPSQTLGSIVRRVSSEADSLRLYEPAYAHQHPGQQYAQSPTYSTQGLYDRAPGPERRLAYPASTVGYAGAPGEGGYGSQGQYSPPLYLPSHGQGGQAQRDNTPRYFAAAPGEPGGL